MAALTIEFSGKDSSARPTNEREHTTNYASKMIVKFGIAALDMGAFFEASLPVKADQLVWVRAQQLDSFRPRGLMPPGSYFHNENQKPATIAVNKAGRGVGKQKQTKQTTSTLGQKNAHRQPT
jgi:hypothetical protein